MDHLSHAKWNDACRSANVLSKHASYWLDVSRLGTFVFAQF